MPRYFFNTRIGGDYFPDTIGADLPTSVDADAAAQVAIRCMTSDPTDAARLVSGTVVVTDAAGCIVLEVPIAPAKTRLARGRSDTTRY